MEVCRKRQRRQWRRIIIIIIIFIIIIFIIIIIIVIIIIMIGAFISIFPSQPKAPQYWKVEACRQWAPLNVQITNLGYYVHSLYIYPSVIIWIRVWKCWMCRWMDLYLYIL